MMGKLSERRIGGLLAAGLLLGGLALGLFSSPGEGYAFPEPLETTDAGTTDLSGQAIVADETFLSDKDNPTGRTNFRDKTLTVDESFTSNLPLVVLDTGEQEPRRNSYYDHDRGYYVPLDIDPYAYGTFSLLDRENGVNRLSDAPVLTSSVKLRVRGNSSGNYDKRQYLLRFTDEDGGRRRQDLLGMGADSDWILNVSFIDKSLLRNYLAYTAAGEIMSYVPDTHFCEVVWRRGDHYEYEGVYLLMEMISVGKNRVDLPQFAENSANLPFLIRRDRYNLTGTILNNYAAREKLLPGFLDVKWLDKEVLSEMSVQRITAQIDRFEEALFAGEFEDFIRYRDWIDLDSFVDYFLLNEFFLNYDAGFNSTYLYADYDGKLTMGPVWDFDQAMDNNETQNANLSTTAFHSAPWFRQMLRDPEFTRLLIQRYGELRRSILSDEAIGSFVDTTIEGLGSAVERDWARWGYFYLEGGYLKEETPGQPDRNTRTYVGEVEKLKTTLSAHGAWMDERLDSLYQFSDPGAPEPRPETGKERHWGSLGAVVFVTAFFVSISLIQRLERGD